jgi:mono/diheme cytochrome c family protein
MLKTMRSMRPTRRLWMPLVLLMALAGLTGCNNMAAQPKFAEPYDSSPTFGRAARELDPGAIPVGFLREDEHLSYGTINGELATTFPPDIEITRAFLERGQQQYNAFCSACHGYSGYGDGIVVQKGLRAPQSFHTDELREAPVGHFYNTIVNGQGIMYSYAARVYKVEDRWAIAAYIRAMQLSQNAAYADLPAEVQAEFEAQ